MRTGMIKAAISGRNYIKYNPRLHENTSIDITQSCFASSLTCIRCYSMYDFYILIIYKKEPAVKAGSFFCIYYFNKSIINYSKESGRLVVEGRRPSLLPPLLLRGLRSRE